MIPQLVGDLFVGANLPVQVGMVDADEVEQPVVIGEHLLFGDPVDQIALRDDEQDDHVAHGIVEVLALLEGIRHLGAAAERLLRFGVEVGAELHEDGQLPVLRQVDAQLTGDLADGGALGAAAHARYGQADVDRRAHAAVEQLALQIDLPVGDGDDVGGDIGADVARERLDDGQRGDGTAPLFFGQLCRALQKAGMQIEHVAGVRLAPCGAFQKQAHRAVGDGVFGEVVIDDEHVLPLIHEIFR